MSASPEGHRHRLFTDRDLGRMIWRALREAGADVEAHDDVFADPRTPDVDWIRYVAGAGRVALTRNKNIRYTPEERACVFDHGARLMVLAGSRVSHADWAVTLAGNLERIYRFIDRNPGPYIAKVHRRRPGVDCRMWVDR